MNPSDRLFRAIRQVVLIGEWWQAFQATALAAYVTKGIVTAIPNTFEQLKETTRKLRRALHG